MTAKEYLKRFLVMQRKVEVRLEEISNLRSMAKSITAVMKDVVPSGR